MTTSEELKQLMDDEVEAAEATRDQPMSDNDIRRRPNRTEVMSLRLNTVELSALQRRAEVLGVSASELARNLIWQGLNTGGASVESTIEELQRDLDRLRQLTET